MGKGFMTKLLFQRFQDIIDTQVSPIIRLFGSAQMDKMGFIHLTAFAHERIYYI